MLISYCQQLVIEVMLEEKRLASYLGLWSFCEFSLPRFSGRVLMLHKGRYRGRN